MIHHRLYGLFFITFFEIPLNYVHHYVLTDLGQWPFPGARNVEPNSNTSGWVRNALSTGALEWLLYKSCVSVGQFLDVLVVDTMKSSSLCSIPTPTKTRCLSLQDNKVRLFDVQKWSRSRNWNGLEAIPGNFLYSSKFVITIPRLWFINVPWHLNSRSKWFLFFIFGQRFVS